MYTVYDQFGKPGQSYVSAVFSVKGNKLRIKIACGPLLLSLCGLECMHMY